MLQGGNQHNLETGQSDEAGRPHGKLQGGKKHVSESAGEIRHYDCACQTRII